jgi:hypothetical protein
MLHALPHLVSQLADGRLAATSVLKWGAPVPAFGNLSRARLATLGINPSNREFVDEGGDELDGDARRFHTLRSLGIRTWSEASSGHYQSIVRSCDRYFSSNPYDTWFRKLDYVIGSTASYYKSVSGTRACHLDLIPYATANKWTALSLSERRNLLALGGETLGQLLANSGIRVLILNGQAVVSHFATLVEGSLLARRRKAWALPRAHGTDVDGYSYEAIVDRVAGVHLGRELIVLGYNHNIQSSFGVTKNVMTLIRTWIERSLRRHFWDLDRVQCVKSYLTRYSKGDAC